MKNGKTCVSTIDEEEQKSQLTSFIDNSPTILNTKMIKV